MHDVASTTTTLSAAAAVGATNVKLASVTGLVVGNTITIDSTGANPETVTMTVVGTSGATGTGVTFTPALAFAHASGATVVKNGVAGTQSLGFGSRGSGLRCTTDAPLVQDPSSSATLYLGCNNLSRSTNRGANWTQIAAPDLLTGPGAGRRLGEQQPALRGPVPDDLDDRAVEVRPEHDLRRHRQRPALEDDRPRRDLAGVPEPVRARPAALGDLGDRRPGGRDACVRVVRRLPRGLHVGERLRDDAGDGAAATTWKNVSGNLPNAPVNFLAYDRANDTLYAATDLGVFFMQSDTEDWTKLGDNLPNTATEDLKIQARAGKLYVGTFGRGTWRIPLVAGTPRYNPQVVTDLASLSNTVGGMGLAAGVTTQLQNSIEAIRKEVKRGESPCADLDALKAQIGVLRAEEDHHGTARPAVLRDRRDQGREPLLAGPWGSRRPAPPRALQLGS